MTDPPDDDVAKTAAELTAVAETAAEALTAVAETAATELVTVAETSRVALAADARTLAKEARTIRRSLDEIARFTVKRRRGVLVLFFLAVAMAIQSHDTHLTKCGIGLDRPGISHAEGWTHNVCDATFPSHRHPGSGGSWPTPGNIVGLAGYSLVFGGGYLWYRRAPTALDVRSSDD